VTANTKKRRRPLRGTFPCPAHIGSDRAFAADRGTLRDQLGSDDEVRRVVSAAESQGYTPGANDIYAPSLARSCGDPEAFIRPGDELGQARAIARHNGLACPGIGVEAPAAEPTETRGKVLAPDIVESIRKQRIGLEPGLADKDQGELREEIVDTHGAEIDD
jgi:hypothetical protein